MNDGHLNIPEDEKQLLNWKTGRKVRIIIFGEGEEATGEDILSKLQVKGLIKAPEKEKLNSLNKRRLIPVKGVKGECMSETVIKLRGAK